MRFRGVNINIHGFRDSERRGGRMNMIIGRWDSAAVQNGRRGAIMVLSGLLAMALAGCQTPQYPPAPVLSATPDFDYHIGPLPTHRHLVD